MKLVPSRHVACPAFLVGSLPGAPDIATGMLFACPNFPTSRSMSSACGHASSGVRLSPSPSAGSICCARSSRRWRRPGGGASALSNGWASGSCWRWTRISFSSSTSGAKGAGKIDQARLRFDSGVLTLTEAGTKKRASLHVLRGRDAVDALHRGGLDVLSATPEAFDAALRRENRTLKRALTDPRFFDGIGNAYSDEILHAARLSPFKQTRSLDDREAGALHAACVGMLTDWTDRLRRDFGLTNEFGNASPGRFPGAGEITAFRSDFAVHGRFGKPCSVCAAPIQRIVYAENECNYCPGCQTEGRILADRSLSRLLKSDWPRSLDELEDGT
jgi:formamidopyrimidine-DNA glycosylase